MNKRFFGVSFMLVVLLISCKEDISESQIFISDISTISNDSIVSYGWVELSEIDEMRIKASLKSASKVSKFYAKSKMVGNFQFLAINKEDSLFIPSNDDFVRMGEDYYAPTDSTFLRRIWAKYIEKVKKTEVKFISNLKSKSECIAPILYGCE